MNQTAVDEKFIEGVSHTLDSVMVPYQGRAEFGNLSRHEEWPTRVFDYAFWWRIHYGKKTIWFGYDGRKGTFDVYGYDAKLANPRQMFTTQYSGEAFEHFERRIEQISL